MKLDKLHKEVKQAITQAGISMEFPLSIVAANPQFGDYSTNIALILAKQMKKNPIEVANNIISKLQKPSYIKTIEVIKPGFINFWVSEDYLISSAEQQVQEQFSFEPYYLGKEKKIMVEYAHPNTHKLFHIGHLRNISTGESVTRLLAAAGNTIIRTNYQGDVGLHIAKCLWGLKQLIVKNGAFFYRDYSLLKKIQLLGKTYSEGQNAYKTQEKSKDEIIEINRQIYTQDKSIIELWKETRQWSLDYYEQIYKRTYVTFDRLYFESELPKRGIAIAHDLLQKGILEKSQGAIVFNGKKYGLDTRVFINSLGFPTYEGKELALAEKEFSEFGKIDKCIHVVTPEQTSFFKVTFKVEELINKEIYGGKQQHLSYAFVQLKEGKMSSRTGNIIEGTWLIDEIKKRIIEQYKDVPADTVETLAIAAVKYSFLKTSTSSEIAFNIDESISLEGNSAAYLLYTIVRTIGILNKAKLLKKQPKKMLPVEQNVLRLLHQFPIVVYQTTEKLSPHILCSYLYELAQAYNFFYQKVPILKAEEENKYIRLLITKSVQVVLKKGLHLLGINTVDHM